jgi:long-chain acyl-CoA synthetase
LPSDLAVAILARCARLPKVTVVGGQERLRWMNLDGLGFQTRVEALAADLAARGVKEGDRVVIWVPEGWRTPALFTAIWRIGAIVVPFDREMNLDSARAILRAVRPALVISGYGRPPSWAPDQGLEEWWDPAPGVSRPSAPKPQVDSARVAAIYFTSGTTGSPKGCTITHGNLLSQVEMLPGVVSIEAGDVFASILPLSHLFELTCGMLYPLIMGATVAYIPSRKGPDIVRVLKTQRATHMIVVPQVLALMGSAAEERLSKLLGAKRYAKLMTFSDRLPMRARRVLFWPILRRLGGRLRVVASGGAALDPTVQLLWERLGVRALQGYGASECSPIIACGTEDGSAPRGTVGKPLPNVEVKIDESGQLLARGPNVMRGYWEDPERTAKVIDAEGFYHTGDLVQRDAQGNIMIMGRAQELLVLPSGMNVWPEDVEEQLRKAGSVRDAVVILAPTPQGGAILHAYLTPIGTPDPALLSGIVSAANGKLAAHQRVATASWWPEEDFPRTSTLKIKRRLIPLPDQVKGAAETSTRVNAAAAADDPVAQAVRAVSGNPAARDGQTLAELGLDSLGVVSLSVEIETRTGITVPDGTIDPMMTLAMLRDAVSSLGGGVEQAAGDGSPSEERIKRAEEADTWLPPLWLYTRGRFLRRLRFPIDLLHRYAVPRVLVEGSEHLTVLRKGAILAGTHRSFPDVPTIQRALRETLSRTDADRLAIAASSVIVGRAGILGKLVTVGFGLFPLRQYGGQEDSLRRLAQIADAGNSVLIFPQGHHTDPGDERLGKPSASFKPGIAHLAANLELPVLPFGLAGTEKVVPPYPPEGFKGKMLGGVPVALTRGPVAIAFGPPLYPAPEESAAAFAARLQSACFALSRRAEGRLAVSRRRR